jgi:hypothetical protein
VKQDERRCACGEAVGPLSRLGLCPDCTKEHHRQRDKAKFAELYRKKREEELGGRLTMPCSCGCGVEVPRANARRYAKPTCERQWRKPKEREYVDRSKPEPQAPSVVCYVPSRFDVDIDPVRDRAVDEILERLARNRRPTVYSSAILGETSGRGGGA